MPELAQRARDLRQLVEAGEAGGPPPAAAGTVEVAAIGLPPERAAALVAAGTERGLAIRAAAALPPEWPPIALLDGSLPGLADGVCEIDHQTAAWISASVAG